MIFVLFACDLFVICVCEFFVISKRVYEEKISDLPLGNKDLQRFLGRKRHKNHHCIVSSPTQLPQFSNGGDKTVQLEHLHSI